MMVAACGNFSREDIPRSSLEFKEAGIDPSQEVRELGRYPSHPSQAFRESREWTYIYPKGLGGCGGNRQAMETGAPGRNDP